MVFLYHFKTFFLSIFALCIPIGLHAQGQWYPEYSKYYSIAERISANPDAEVRKISRFFDAIIDKLPAQSEHQLISPQAAASLGIVSQDPKSLYGILSRYCATEAGKLMLADILLVDDGYTTTRQERIKNINVLLQSPEQRDEYVHKLLAFERDSESYIQNIVFNRSAIQTINTIPENLGGSLFAKEPYLRSAQFQTLRWGTYGILSSATGLLGMAGMSAIRSVPIDFDTLSGFQQTIQGVMNLPVTFAHNVVKGVGFWQIGEWIYKWARGKEIAESRSTIAASAALTAYLVADISIKYMNVRSKYAFENKRIRSHMEAIAQLMELIPGNTYSACITEIRSALTSRVPGRLQELYARFVHDEYDPVLQSKAGRLLAAAYRDFGELDALCAVARWAAENKEHVTVPEIKHALNLKDMWALEIGAGQSKKSSIMLDEKTKLLKIEGPNGFGKSTILRMIGNNIVLANRFGLVAAGKGSTMPPYRSLCYIANVQEARGTQSTGQAQGASFQKILKALKDTDMRTFVALDEPLSGTQCDVAKDNIIALAAAVCDNPYTAGVLVTHFNFEFPKELSKISYAHLGDSGNNEAELLNGKAEVSGYSHSLFKPTYQLKEGRHAWWFDTSKHAGQLRTMFGAWMFGDAHSKQKTMNS